MNVNVRIHAWNFLLNRGKPLNELVSQINLTRNIEIKLYT